ncbi:universal stress protein [Glaciibacter sp. 2TAF33]|uniref:universal stress protein n=1 Tax=Glaciibacter sp. 2TAF33 TaxID=3233015 RepID=UPI003F908883
MSTPADTGATGPAGASIVAGVFPGQPDRVILEAAGFARRFNAELVCVQVNAAGYLVYETPDGMVSSLPFDPDLPELDDPGFDPDLSDHLGHLLDATGVSWSTRSVTGDVPTSIAALADTLDAALIVVGTRRHGLRSSVQEFFAGSVAAQLSHRQPRPVVVIPLTPVTDDSALPWETDA